MRWMTVLTGLLVCVAGTTTSHGRPFRPSMYPNGTTVGCAACHINPAGGGTRTPFGNRVFAIIGGSSAAVPFWSPALAAEDSDGDTYCNGQEVGDPDGDGVATPAATVTNPGVSTSRPANTLPVFASTPVLQAAVGLLYQYQAAATDTDACQALTFSKVEGPAWLSVSTAGLASGTPPDGAGGDAIVTVQASDNGSPAQTTNQTFTLSVVSSFAGWQNLNFNLPAEADLARPTEDPDGDRIVNAVEYAYRSDPHIANVPARPLPTFDAGQRMVMSTSLRDDDPTLTARMEVADTILFAPLSPVVGDVTDPTPGDGLKTWTFVDPVAQSGSAARFGRIRIIFEPVP